MMLAPGFHVYLQPRVTLTFDLLTSKVDRPFHMKYKIQK